MKKDWHDLVSQPKYKVKVQKDIFVKMRDGIKIATDVYFPDTQGKFPALICFSPYSKEMQELPIPNFPTSRDLSNGGIECGRVDWFVTRGYVVVIADARGTGLSEGAYGTFTMKEQKDVYELVEWTGKQPWCNGNVGMLGISYFGMIQNHVAALNPPHLKAIFPVEPCADLYRDWAYHGGILDVGFVTNWYDIVMDHTYELPDISESDLKGMIEELKKNEDVRCFPNVYRTLVCRGKNPHLQDILLHPYDGPFYWERSGHTKFSQIKVPTFYMSRWAAWCIHLRGAISAYCEVNVPKKLMITVPESGVGFNRPWHEHHDIVLRWYDHWLKGIDTGIMDEPPIKILVQGVNKWRDENEWPLARTQWTKYYLRKRGMLSTTPPADDEATDSFTNIPKWQVGATSPGVKYTTAVLKEDVEVTGPIALYFHASLDSEDANWMVEVLDIGPDGSENRASIGWLKASLREIDSSKSKPYLPWHPFVRKSPVKPGEVYEYAVDIKDTSLVFRAGHRIQLIIKGQDFPWEGKAYYYAWWWHLPNSTKTIHTIYHTSKYPSYLLLPIIPKT
jgi:predicted acyl esterase